jgi:hypothetical protein
MAITLLFGPAAVLVGCGLFLQDGIVTMITLGTTDSAVSPLGFCRRSGFWDHCFLESIGHFVSLLG